MYTAIVQCMQEYPAGMWGCSPRSRLGTVEGARDDGLQCAESIASTAQGHGGDLDGAVVVAAGAARADALDDSGSTGGNHTVALQLA